MVALAVVEVVCSQCAVGLVVCEQVAESGDHGMADGEHCTTLASFATARGDTTKLSRQVRFLQSASDS